MPSESAVMNISLISFCFYLYFALLWAIGVALYTISVSNICNVYKSEFKSLIFLYMFAISPNNELQPIIIEYINLNNILIKQPSLIFYVLHFDIAN